MMGASASVLVPTGGPAKDAHFSAPRGKGPHLLRHDASPANFLQDCTGRAAVHVVVSVPSQIECHSYRSKLSASLELAIQAD